MYVAYTPGYVLQSKRDIDKGEDFRDLLMRWAPGAGETLIKMEIFATC